MKYTKAFLRAQISAVAVASAVLSAAPAVAQENAEEASNSASQGGIETIVVTAQRRPEDVQKSSLPISVLGQKDLAKAGVTNPQDLSRLVSGVRVTSGGARVATYIRGVGEASATSAYQTSVAYNIDDVYVADPSTVTPLFYDLARVEVLKGPHGTLYGRNTSAGSVNLIYTLPKLSEISGYMTASYGNYDDKQLVGAVNVPIGAVAAVRLSGNFVNRDGYLSDGTYDDDRYAGRLQFLLEPNDRFTLRVTGDVAHVGGRGTGVVVIPHQAGNGKFTGAINAANNAAILAISPFPYTPGAGLPPIAQTGLLHDTFMDHDQASIGAQLDYDVGFGTVTFIPAYRWSNTDSGSYGGYPGMFQDKVNQTSYELRFSRDSDWLAFVIGGYFLDIDTETGAQVYASVLAKALNDDTLDTRSYAGYGQATIRLSDTFRFVGGLRYTSEDQTFIGTADTGRLAAFSEKARFSRWTYRAGVEYDLSPGHMVYAIASEGFKSGGFNFFAPTPQFTNVYQPEILDSYTIGSRNRFLNGTVQLNVEAFYWDYKDIQKSRIGFTPAGDLQFITSNAAAARIYGAEISLVAQPTPHDSIKATLVYLDSKFTSFAFETPFPTDPRSTACGLTALPPFITDCTGRPLPHSPHWSGTASYDHIFEVANGGSFVLGGSLDFASSSFNGLEYIENERNPGFVRLNADLTYNSPNDRFSITAFIRNITNREIRINGSQGFAPTLVFSQVDPPRTYGVRATVRF